MSVIPVKCLQLTTECFEIAQVASSIPFVGTKLILAQKLLQTFILSSSMKQGPWFLRNFQLKGKIP